MKGSLTVLLVLACVQVSFGQVELSGRLIGIYQGYYWIVGPIWIEALDEVTLLPGTTFDFRGAYGFQIWGTLSAPGSGPNSIVFSAYEPNLYRWRGIRFLGSGSSLSGLTYCLIQWSQSGQGGGVLCSQSSPTFTNCIVTRDSATGAGGGIYCEDGSPSFIGCSVMGNDAVSAGGGICCNNSTAIFRDCLITCNRAAIGGGVSCGSYSAATFANCTIIRDTAYGDGGGVYCADSWPAYMNCTIIENRSYGDGGGIYCGPSSSATFTNCTVDSNRASNDGGGVHCRNSSPTLTNCIIIENRAGSSGGGACCDSASSPVFTHCTLSGDSAGSGLGDGAYIGFSAPTFNSTIIAFSTGTGICFSNSAGSQIRYCDIFGHSNGNIANPSAGPPGIAQLVRTNANGDSCDIYLNIFLNPRFAAPPTADFHLTDSSSCIGAANPTNPPPFDIDSDPRPNPPASNPDIGADENPLGAPRAPVFPLSGALRRTLGPGIYPVVGSIWINSGDSLRLVPGTTLRFDGPYPFTVYGTLLAEGTAGDSISIRFTTEQSDTNRWRGLRFLGSTSSGSRLAYCLIENGYATGGLFNSVGGGVYCDSSSPRFTTCTFRNNRASLGGGVFCMNSASPNFTNGTFSGNLGTSGGSGIVCIGPCLASFANCTISGNGIVTQNGMGAGVYCGGYDCSPLFANCTVSENGFTSPLPPRRVRGGGVACADGSSPRLVNCLFRENRGWRGGGLYDTGSLATITHCTFWWNTGTSGGTAYLEMDSSAFNSTIFCGPGGILFNESPDDQIGFCDINSSIGYLNGDPSDAPAGLGQVVGTNANGDPCDIYRNILLDPLFVDTAANNFHLADFSHCIGAADTSDTVSTDFDGNPRPNPPGSNPDIGAYENTRATPFVSAVTDVVVHIENGNAVLNWSRVPQTTSYNIYGTVTPSALGNQLGSVADTAWTDLQTSNRPSPYFYYVTAATP